MTTQNQKTLTAKDLPALIHQISDCSTSNYQYLCIRVIAKFELLLSASPNTRTTVNDSLEGFIEGVLSILRNPSCDLDKQLVSSLERVKELAHCFTYSIFYSAELAPPLDSVENNQEATFLEPVCIPSSDLEIDHIPMFNGLCAECSFEFPEVVYQNQKPVTREQFKLFDDAFLFVESLCKDAFHQVDIFVSVEVLSGSGVKKAHYITSAFCRDSETFNG